MSCIRIVDTSVLCNILRVPNRDQEVERAGGEFRQAIKDGDTILLPVPVIYETGNHIAQNGDGRVRRRLSLNFVDLVRRAFNGDLPFTPTPVHDADAMLKWLGDFPDNATRGVGFSDLAILRIYEEQCELNKARRVLIWSYDAHLQGYDRAPTV